MDFDGEWDRGFGDNLIEQLTKVNDADRDMNALYYGGGGRSGISSAQNHFRVVYCESHDLVGDLNGPGNLRLPTRIDGGDPDSYWARKRSMLGAAVILTMPGVPMVFMGQEMLEDEQFGDGNPLDWTHATTYPDVVNFFRDMIHLRRDLDGVSLGLKGANITTHVVRNDAPWKLLAFHRWGAGADDEVMVVMNFTANNIPAYAIHSWPVDGNWYVNLNSDSTQYGSDFGNQGSSVVTVSSGSGTLAVGPYSVLILSRQALADLDHDGDGLLSGWEQQYFGDPLVAVPTDDDDHDGASNAEEQAADTIPTQAASVLKLLSVDRNAGTLTLTWQGGVNAQQVVQKATVASGPWTDIHTNNPPTAITNSLVIAAPEGDAYFRVQVGM
jgi:1,4-alpha-glucan branching enzyme